MVAEPFLLRRTNSAPMARRRDDLRVIAGCGWDDAGERIRTPTLWAGAVPVRPTGTNCSVRAARLNVPPIGDRRLFGATMAEERRTVRGRPGGGDETTRSFECGRPLVSTDSAYVGMAALVAGLRVARPTEGCGGDDACRACPRCPGDTISGVASRRRVWHRRGDRAWRR